LTKTKCAKRCTKSQNSGTGSILTFKHCFGVWRQPINLYVVLALALADYGQTSDCNPEIEFSIRGSGIEKFVIPGSRDPISKLSLQNGRCFGIHSRLISCTRM